MPSQFDWLTNGANYNFNPNYGFGQVDALAAVSMAAEWQLLPEEEDPLVAVQGNLNAQIPDGVAGSLTYDFTMPSQQNVDYVVEYAELSINASHSEISDIQIVITSPSGTSIRLPRPYLQDPEADYFISINRLDHIFGLQCFRGERAPGNWRVTVSDVLTNGETGILESLELVVYGYNGLLKPRIENWDEAIAQSTEPYEMFIDGANFNESSVVILTHPVVGTRAGFVQLHQRRSVVFYCSGFVLGSNGYFFFDSSSKR